MHDKYPSRFVAACCLFLVTLPMAVADPLDVRWEIPDSLASWYKPQNQRQVWLHTMFALRRELQAVEEYAAVDDWDRLTPWAERFGRHYRKIQDMVPEWADELNLEAVADLERAAQERNKETLVSARRQLVKTCKSCHGEFRALVAARFRAPDLSALKVKDGEGKEREITEQMELLSRAVNRIKIATEDSRWQAAADALGKLRGELTFLGETCSACHRDQAPRERILGAATLNSLDRIAQGFDEKDRKLVGRALGQTAVEVCARCHGSHRLLSDLIGVMLPPRN